MKNYFYRPFDEERVEAARPPQEGEHRSAFQMDRDRIIHSSAFRRLQNKTQVFFSGEYDFYRTRLTHSIEVAQIGRGLCDYLNSTSSLLGPEYFIDPNLVEAGCLSHDIGHPPFGHTGERALHRLMRPYGGFEGNAQTLRILSQLLFRTDRGMNPSRALIDGILKYKTLFGAIPDQENHFLYAEQAPLLKFVLGGQAFPDELTPGKLRNGFRSVECQIMDWADDTAYSLHDIADGVEAGFIHSDQIRRWSEGKDLSTFEGGLLEELCIAVRNGEIERITGRKIGHFVRAVELQKAPEGAFLADQTSRHAYRLSIDPEIMEECRLYKRVATDLVFQSQQLQQLDLKSDHILTQLFEVFAEFYIAPDKPKSGHFQLLSSEEEKLIFSQPDEASRARLICDVLAKMTDGVATRTYRRLFDADFGSILDLV